MKKGNIKKISSLVVYATFLLSLTNCFVQRKSEKQDAATKIEKPETTTTTTTTTTTNTANNGEKQDVETKTEKLETATLAAGCFWGMEEFFRKIPGVVETRVGFTGGTVPNPKYEDTNDGHTGHAESIEIKFDPNKVSFDYLLDQFFKMHDPTTPNQQGNDKGSQYRSAIFYHGEEQKKKTMAFIEKVERSGAWKAPIVTEVAEAKVFWPAEEYHQKYIQKNGGGYDNHYLRNISFDVDASKEKKKQ